MSALEHIRWLGGGTGAGKTTIARLLAEKTGVSVYSTDATIGAHGSKLTATDAPLLDRFRQMRMDERWVVRDPAEMYRTFPWFHGEGFDCLLDDLHALPTDQITVVEGFRLLPDLVRPLLPASTSAVWLIPTPSFRRGCFVARDGADAFWLRTSNPPKALDNLLARDALFTTELATAAARHRLATITIDGARDPASTAATIAEQFRL